MLTRIQPLVRCCGNSQVIMCRPPLVCHVARTITDQPDFSNTKQAFQSKRLSDLLRAYVVYKMFSYTSLVNNSDKVLVAMATSDQE